MIDEIFPNHFKTPINAFSFHHFSSRMNTLMTGDEPDNDSRKNQRSLQSVGTFSLRKEKGGGERRLQDARLAKVLAMAINVQNQPVESKKSVSRIYLRDSRFPVYPTSVPPFRMLIVSYGVPVLRCQLRESKASQLLLFLTKYRHSCIQLFS